ncbi:MAG: aspartyl protease family protein, partial [Halobaculum sp.]
LGHTPVWLGRSNVESGISGARVEITPEVDVAINRLLLTKSDSPLCDLALAGVIADQVPTLNPPDDVAAMLHKYRAAARLARKGIPVPDTVLAAARTAPESWVERVGPDAVRKPGIGTNGAGVDRVSPDDTVTHYDDSYLVQRFHPSRGERHSDVRVYVVDGAVVGAMRRKAPSGEWRSNVALGGETEDVTDSLPTTAKQTAVDATDALSLDCAGVDLVPAESGGGWSVLEVNATAGFKGLFAATGVSAAPYIAAAAIRRAGGSVSTDAVDRAAAELDDSLPDCAPDDVLVGDDDVIGTVGYATEIRVAGHDGAISTTAKSDTGADRTTIDLDVARDIGAGPISDTTTVRSSTGSEERPVVPVSILLGGEWHDLDVGVTDRSQNSHSVLLGRDLLTRFQIDPRVEMEE